MVVKLCVLVSKRSQKWTQADTKVTLHPPPTMDRFSIGHEFPVHFFKERESDNRSVLFIGTHTQLWLVVVLKFSPIRAQEMGIHVLY